MSSSQTDPDDILDDEILEIFVEEAEEVIEEINTSLALWSEDPADKSAADAIRRAFHTLKGSGRMVRAQEVSDLSGAMESMLNQVVDGSAPITDSMMSLVKNVSKDIPRLVGAFQNHQASAIVDVNVELLVSQANALANGETIIEPEPQGPPLLTDAESDQGDFAVPEHNEMFDQYNERIDALTGNVDRLSDHMRRLLEEFGNIKSDIPAMASDSDVRELSEKMIATEKEIQDLKYFVKASAEKAQEEKKELAMVLTAKLNHADKQFKAVGEELSDDVKQAINELHSVNGRIVKWSIGSALLCSLIASAVVYVLVAVM